MIPTMLMFFLDLASPRRKASFDFYNTKLSNDVQVALDVFEHVYHSVS